MQISQLGVWCPLLIFVLTLTIANTCMANENAQAHCRWQSGQERAGNPQQVAWYAKGTETKHHSYGWIGGGVLFGRGDNPQSNEGTWGRDYYLLNYQRVWLGWSHGRQYEGGAGAYKTEGPKVHLHKE